MKYKNIIDPNKVSAVSVQNAANLIGVSRQYLFKLIMKKDIVSFKLGTRRLVSIKAINAFIKKKEQENREIEE